MLYFFLILFGTAVAFDKEIHSKYQELEREEFVQYFNSLNLTFKIGVKGLDAGHKHCSYIDHEAFVPTVVHDIDALELPESFDAREKWSNCPSIDKIYNQLSCGACWMFGTATTASDRNCIHANIIEDLSEQDLSCCTDCYQRKLCDGGSPHHSFNYWINNGLVSYNCQPYDDKVLMSDQYCTRSCANGNDYNQDKNYGGRVYSLSPDEGQIKAELYNNGPIEAVMKVYSDFQDYTNGVYTHKYGEYVGLHSVRIIGYGEEDGMKYWLVANSWGRQKGENGFYKIQQFHTDLEIEQNLLAAMPKGY